MKAIILAAGTGSRLMPSNPNTPKCLVDLGGTPLLERMVSTLRYCEIGFESIYLVAGFNFEMVSRAMEKFDGIHILKNEDYLTKDNMSSLDIALCALPKMNEEIAIMNGDTLHQKSLARRFLRAEETSS